MSDFRPSIAPAAHSTYLYYDPKKLQIESLEHKIITKPLLML